MVDRYNKGACVRFSFFFLASERARRLPPSLLSCSALLREDQRDYCSYPRCCATISCIGARLYSARSGTYSY